MESFRAIVEKQLARRGTSPIRAALDAGLSRDAIRSVLRGRAPSVDRAAEICEALDLEFYVGPPRAESDDTPAEARSGRVLGHIRDRRLGEILALIVGHWQSLGSEYARIDFVERLYEREPLLREAARKRLGRRHRFPKRALDAVSEELQALGADAGDDGIEVAGLLESLRGLGVRAGHPVFRELGRLEGRQPHAVICQAFLRAAVWVDVSIRPPAEAATRPGQLRVEWRRPNYRVVYSADLAHIGARLDDDWVVMLAGDVERLIAEGLVADQSREQHLPCPAGAPATLVTKLVLAPPPGGAPTTP